MSFDQAFNLVVGVEGKYSNDPRDPGGETQYGISKRAYPQLDIANLTLGAAKEIYLRDYWRACKCDELPKDIALVMFDCAVNQGVQTALALHSDHPTLIAFQAERAVRYAKLQTFPTFGRGWMRRLFTIFQAAKEAL